jgi:hypothetical protein
MKLRVQYQNIAAKGIDLVGKQLIEHKSIHSAIRAALIDKLELDQTAINELMVPIYASFITDPAKAFIEYLSFEHRPSVVR